MDVVQLGPPPSAHLSVARQTPNGIVVVVVVVVVVDRVFNRSSFSVRTPMRSAWWPV